jgi:hypothetical protein
MIYDMIITMNIFVFVFVKMITLLEITIKLHYSNARCKLSSFKIMLDNLQTLWLMRNE